MALWTTYLSFIARNQDEINAKLREISDKHGIVIHHVMRNRGNNEVAPVTSGLIEATKSKDWELYKHLYLERLGEKSALKWMEQVAEDSKTVEVILVCFEKDAEHCHRTLLAKEIVKHFPFVDYRGELSKLLEKEGK